MTGARVEAGGPLLLYGSSTGKLRSAPGLASADRDIATGEGTVIAVVEPGVDRNRLAIADNIRGPLGTRSRRHAAQGALIEQPRDVRRLLGKEPQRVIDHDDTDGT
jgi:hypothetical protein